MDGSSTSHHLINNLFASILSGIYAVDISVNHPLNIALSKNIICVTCPDSYYILTKVGLSFTYATRPIKTTFLFSVYSL